MKKLPISIGVLAWNSGQTLIDTLTTYYENGLLDIVNDTTILFQEFNEIDFQISKHFQLMMFLFYLQVILKSIIQELLS